MLKKLLETIVRELPGIVCLKSDQGIFLACNKSFMDLAGLAEDKIIGHTDSDMPWGNQYANIRENDLRVISTRKSCVFSEANFIFKKIPLFIEELNSAGILSLSIDMSKFIKDIESNYFKLSEIISVLPGHVYWKDRNCILQGCNDEQAKDVGLNSRHDIVGKTAYDLIFQDQPEEEKRKQAKITDNIDHKIMDEDKPSSVEEFVVTPEGETIYYYSRKVPLHDSNGKVNGLLGVSLDITEKVLLEKKLEEMLKRYEDFVLNQEHDSLTPYASLVSVAEELVDLVEESKDDLLKEFADIILKSSSALCDYQKSLLDGIYLFNDITERYSRKFNIREMMEQLEDIFSITAKEKSLSLIIKVDENIPTYLVGDEFRLRNCLMCLLSNAFKYTDKGKIEIRCLAEPCPKENTIILDIQVEDTGIGIEKDNLAVIFEPFSRLTLSNIGKYEGRGTGLAYVKKMVEEIEGEVDVKSEVGKGSVFSITVPMSIALLQRPTPSPKGE